MTEQIINRAKNRIESFPKELVETMRNARPERTYEKGHVFPISIPDRFGEADETILNWDAVSSISNPLRLYVHIPWCKSKCTFCFYESDIKVPNDEAVEKYIDALTKELALYSKKIGRDKIDTEVLYIGGGTPTILTPTQINRLFEGIRTHINFIPGAFLISESSPGTLTKEKVNALRNNGVNRMSIGIQTLDDEILKLCRRDHDAQQAKSTYQLIREVGIPEVNIDLMLALPNQSYESFRKTLEETIQLEPSSISFLDLRICPGSALFSRLQRDKCSIPDWLDDIVMRAIYQEVMKDTSYVRTRPHYYIKPEEMKHRATRVPCLDSRFDLGFQIGVGVSAYSHLEDVAFINATGNKYFELLSSDKLPIKTATVLTKADKTAMRAIRTIIDTTTVPNREDVIGQYKSEIEYLQKSGLLSPNFELTDDGCLFGEEVVYSFYPKKDDAEDLANYEVGWWTERHKKNPEAMTRQLARLYVLQFGLPYNQAREAAELKVKATEHHDSAKKYDSVIKDFPYLRENHIKRSEEEWRTARDLLKKHFDIIYSK